MNENYPILCKNTNDTFVMNELQESYLYGRLLPNDSTISFTYTEFKIVNLNIAKLEEAWNRIIQNYSILRATLSDSGKMVIRKYEPYQICQHEISEPISNKYLENYRNMNVTCLTYPLEKYPLYQIEVTQFSDISVIHFYVDSIIIDGVSADLILHQWKFLYLNPDNFIEAESITCSDYNFSLLEFKRNSQAYRYHLDYWKKKLHHLQELSFQEYHSQYSTKRERLSAMILKEDILLDMKKNMINYSTYFLDLFDNTILNLNKQKPCVCIITLNNRHMITEQIDKLVGVMTNTIIHIAENNKKKDIIKKIRHKQNDLFNDFENSYANSINVLRELELQNVNIPFVFTYKKKSPLKSFSSDQIYTLTQTPNVFLECVITEDIDRFLVDWYVAKEYFKVDICSLFQSFLNDNRKWHENAGGIELLISSLQASYLSRRLQGNLTGVIYKLFRIETRDVNVIVKQIKEVVNQLQYKVDCHKGRILFDQSTGTIGIYEYETEEFPEEFFNHRKLIINEVAANVDGLGNKVDVISLREQRYIEICLDMSIFDGFLVMKLIDRLLKKANGKIQQNIFIYPFEPNINVLRDPDDEYICRIVECNLFSPAFAEQDKLPLLIYSITYVISAWFPEICREIALVEFETRDQQDPITVVNDKTILSYIDLSCLELAVGSKETMKKVQTAMGNRIYTPTSVPRIAITNCLDLQFDHSGEIQALSYAATPDIILDAVIYKTLYGINVELNACKQYISVEQLEVIHDQIKYVLKETINNKRRVAMDKSEMLIHKSLTKNFLENNQNNLSFSDYKKIIYDWNSTVTIFNKQMLIQDAFLNSVRNFPNQIAVRTNEVEVTYAELDRMSNTIANYLCRLDRGKEVSLVGIYMERNENLIAAILGILKAGMAYLPFNMSDPDNRIENIIVDAELKILLTDKEFSEKKIFTALTRGIVSEIISLGFDETENHRFDQHASDLAYVIFTSGSTGRPKGVAVNHSSVMNLIEWVGKVFPINSNDRVIFVNPINFDLSVFDLFGILAAGGTIRVVNDMDRKNPFRICEIIKTEQITFWNSAPAYLNMIIPMLESENIVGELRLFFLSGDWIPIELAKRLKTDYPSSTVVSLGGATEATVWSNYYIIDQISNEWKSIPYGRPIQNSMYYILDENLNPVGVNKKGELYIAGECLSLGYYKNSRLTEERFIDNPFNKHYKKMYKTGDAASYFNDGNIEFLGRLDNQIKLRGYRIELGEIENIIKANGYTNCVAVVYQDEIYICIEQLGEIQELKNVMLENALKKELPDYMIPKKILCFPQFPTTENGKLDRKGIEEMVQLFCNNKKSVLDNQDNVDQLNIKDHLREIINEIIGYDTNGEMDLGEMGFNSLKYTLLSIQLKKAFDVEVNPTLFYKFNSIKQLEEYFISELNKIKKSNSTVFKDKKEEVINPVKNLPISDIISIISMDYQLPDDNYKTFEDVIFRGENCVRTIPENRWDYHIYQKNSKRNGQNTTDVIYGNFISNIKDFDPLLFHISPREAELMDPRQRLLLESIWRLLERGGYSREALKGKKVGVFLGVTGDEYYNLCRESSVPIDELSLIGSSKTVLANRINYFFDWNGPSEVVDTACSSSLVAIHRAVQSLRTKECELAIAGGINLIIDVLPHISLDKIGMLSPDGKCKTFDQRADGYGRGEGYGVVLLKPEEYARQDHDYVFANIIATKVNHGGKANALTAPNPNAQASLIKSTLEEANLDINKLRYIETHGTGTQLGDPIEINGIKDAFSQYCKDHQMVWATDTYLGAVKANIGHLEAAAGIAGLVKMILCMKKGEIPPVAQLESINTNIDLSDSHLVIPTEKIEWNDEVKIGSVSAFGFGGVNAHIILESSSVDTDLVQQREDYLFPLSAQTDELMAQYLRNMLTILKELDWKEDSLENTLIRRTGHRVRLCIIFSSREELINCLSDLVDGIHDHEEQIYFGDILKDFDKVQNIMGQNRFENMTKSERAQLWCWGINQVLIADYTSTVMWDIPVSPFKQKEYWYEDYEQAVKTTKYVQPSIEMNKLGKIVVVGNEKFLNDHMIYNKKVIPGAMYLEYVMYIMKNKAGVIRNITWEKMIADQWPTTFNIYKKEQKISEELLFSCGEKIVFSCNVQSSDLPAENETIQFKDMIVKANRSHESIYSEFLERGIDYGGTFKVLNKAYIETDTAFGMFVRSPVNMSYIDGIFQLVILMHQSSDSFVPFYLESFTFFEELKNSDYGFVKKTTQKGSKLEKFDGTLIAEDGRCIAKLKGYSGRSEKKNYNGINILTEKYKVTEVVNSEDGRNSYLWNQGEKELLFASGQKSLHILNSIDEVKQAIQTKQLEKENLLIILPKYTADYEKIIREFFEVIQDILNKDLSLNLILFNPEVTLYDEYIYEALAALGKVAVEESSKLTFKMVKCRDGLASIPIHKIISSVLDSNHHEFKLHKNGKLEHKVVIPYQDDFEKLDINPDSYYLITGGNGVIAKKLYNKILSLNGIPIMLSRNPILSDSGIHVKTDLCDLHTLTSVLNKVVTSYKDIRGVFHLAGSTNDRMILFKNYRSFRKTLIPKMDGTINLLEFIRRANVRLDFFINFSSIVSITGNKGQGDYAMANRFLDSIVYDQSLVNNIRVFKSINWCYWQRGGMKINEAGLSDMKAEGGLLPISDESAFEVLFHKLIPGNGNQIVAIGEQSKIIEYLNR